MLQSAGRSILSVLSVVSLSRGLVGGNRPYHRPLVQRRGSEHLSMRLLEGGPAPAHAPLRIEIATFVPLRATATGTRLSIQTALRAPSSRRVNVRQCTARISTEQTQTQRQCVTDHSISGGR